MQSLNDEKVQIFLYPYPIDSPPNAIVWAAIQRAKILGQGKKVATVVCNLGLKDLQGDVYK